MLSSLLWLQAVVSFLLRLRFLLISYWRLLSPASTFFISVALYWAPMYGRAEGKQTQTQRRDAHTDPVRSAPLIPLSRPSLFLFVRSPHLWLFVSGSLQQVHYTFEPPSDHTSLLSTTKPMLVRLKWALYIVPMNTSLLADKPYRLSILFFPPKLLLLFVCMLWCFLCFFCGGKRFLEHDLPNYIHLIEIAVWFVWYTARNIVISTLFSDFLVYPNYCAHSKTKAQI